MKQFGRVTRKIRIPKTMATPGNMIRNLPDEVGYFSEMSDEEYMDYIDKYFLEIKGKVDGDDSDRFYVFADPQKALENEDHFAMLAGTYVYGDLTDDELVKCIENKEYCREKFKGVIAKGHEESDEEIDKMEQGYDELPEKTRQYQKNIDAIRDQDAQNRELFGDATSPMEDYCKLIEESQKGISFEDYAIQQAYVNGGFGTNAERLNKKLYQGEELTAGEKEFVEKLRGTATELPSDMMLYRMVDAEAVEKMFSSSDPKSGDTITLGGFGSSCVGSMAQNWAGYPVALRIHAKQGMKVIAPYNQFEGEVLMLNGLKGKVISAKESDEDLPMLSLYGTIESPESLGWQKTKRLIVDIEVTDDGSDL